MFEGGPAHGAGLNPGDRLLSVNDIPVTGHTYPEVVSLIENYRGLLKLQVLPEHEDILQMVRYRYSGVCIGDVCLSVCLSVIENYRGLLKLQVLPEHEDILQMVRYRYSGVCIGDVCLSVCL